VVWIVDIFHEFGRLLLEKQDACFTFTRWQLYGDDHLIPHVVLTYLIDPLQAEFLGSDPQILFQIIRITLTH
jgi:hypothetical protein